ncbi:MAG: hypothetical protein ABUK01_16730 [Leptospirales bacterium]
MQILPISIKLLETLYKNQDKELWKSKKIAIDIDPIRAIVKEYTNGKVVNLYYIYVLKKIGLAAYNETHSFNFNDQPKLKNVDSKIKEESVQVDFSEKTKGCPVCGEFKLKLYFMGNPEYFQCLNCGLFIEFGRETLENSPYEVSYLWKK